MLWLFFYFLSLFLFLFLFINNTFLIGINLHFCGHSACFFPFFRLLCTFQAQSFQFLASPGSYWVLSNSALVVHTSIHPIQKSLWIPKVYFNPAHTGTNKFMICVQLSSSQSMYWQVNYKTLSSHFLCHQKWLPINHIHT